MAQTAWQDGRVPWTRRALSAVAVMTLAVAGTRAAVAAPSDGAENGRMACGDAPRPPVRLHLIDRARLSAAARVELMRETIAPWRAVDASVEWVAGLPSRPARLGEPKDLYVVIVADAEEASAGQPMPMASILFVSGQPTTRITVHAGHVARRLAGMRFDDLPFADRPRLIRDRVLGRVLGRAVAHEVGHFLSSSREHAAVGLMRARHRIERLMAPDHPIFRLPAPATPDCRVARNERPSAPE
jgi:hypothetical protein